MQREWEAWGSSPAEGNTGVHFLKDSCWGFEDDLMVFIYEGYLVIRVFSVGNAICTLPIVTKKCNSSLVCNNQRKINNYPTLCGTFRCF